MHIEPGLVSEAKLSLSYGTGSAALAYGAKRGFDTIRDSGAAALVVRAAICSVLVFAFFQVLPHVPVGISEVHLILGSTLFLMFGAGPAAIGLALGLLAQGLFFEPQDLPQYGMNVSTLLFPLFAVAALGNRIISHGTPYVDLKYGQALALSTAYQGGVVLWVAFWALYGAGAGADNLAAITTFGGAYMLVILIEPLADLAVLAGAKSLRGLRTTGLFTRRLHGAG